MLPQLSLKARIFTSFAIIVVLLSTNGLVSYIGSNRLSNEVRRIQQVESVNASVLNVDRDVQELRLRVDRFVSTGYDSQRAEALNIYGRLQKLIESTKEQLEEGEMANIFTQIGTHVEQYMQQFDLVIEERRIRRELFQQQLPASSQKVEELFDKLTTASADGNSEQTRLLALSQAHAYFSQAEQSLLRYFETPDTKHVNEAVAHLKLAEAKIKETENLAAEQQLLLDKINEHRAIGLQAVQSTRGYLFFLNVVMAGEASEISYYSNLLRQLAEESRDRIGQRITSTSDNIKRVTGLTLAIASILSVLIAARLAFLIIPPITALTGAFQKLSAGESLGQVPGADREDEIGLMAQAARVFSNQNSKTRELLKRSEALSEELHAKAAQLEESNEELDSFAYIASHDLKSPLRGIRQLATWIEEDSGKQLSEESLQHLEQLKARIAKMENLLSDLLNYSRVGRMRPEPEQVDLSQVMEDIVDITDNPSNVAIQWADDLPSFTTLRPPLEQVLMNLVGNAIKHNNREEGGVVEFDWSLEGDRYRFRVQDNGPGIDQRHHQRVFQMYQRVGDPDVEGSGMGLAIVKKQIEHMGGEVHLESQPGKGSKFEFTWPVNPPAAQEEQ